jgi:hypothetical protein
LPASADCQKLTVTPISASSDNRSESRTQRDSGAAVCAARSTMTLFALPPRQALQNGGNLVQALIGVHNDRRRVVGIKAGERGVRAVRVEAGEGLPRSMKYCASRRAATDLPTPPFSPPMKLSDGML